MTQANYIIATTYLKLLLNQSELVRILDTSTNGAYKEWFSDDYVKSSEIEPIFQAFAEAGLDSWVMKFGQGLDNTAHGPPGFAMLSAPDLRSALNVFCDYFCLRTNAYSNELVVTEDRLIIKADDQTDSELAGRWLIEAGMKTAQRLIENLMAHTLKDNALIRFAHPKPSYASELQAYFGIPCEFNAGENTFSIPASWGGIPSPLADAGAYRTNLAKCKELKQQLSNDSDILNSTKIKLEKFFSDCINGEEKPSALPSLNSLANEFALSPRTYARRLEAQQSSYKAELEFARQQQAKHLLLNTHMRVADIAYCLAYQEPANFIRAFKQWFKLTPTQWRRSPSPYAN